MDSDVQKLQAALQLSSLKESTRRSDSPNGSLNFSSTSTKIGSDSEHGDFSAAGTERFKTYINYEHTTSWDDVEDVSEYRAGGYHPIAIGDLLSGGKYKIIHKLGHGGYSTVWLAHNTLSSSYVAIKILMADHSHEALAKEEAMQQTAKKFPCTRFNMSLGYIWITGPKGRHLAVISEVCGPSLSRIIEAKRLSGSVAQKLGCQIVKAVGCLHKYGMAHGDLTCDNILLELRDISKIPPNKMLEILGPPRGQLVAGIDKDLITNVPTHVYESADTMKLLPYWTWDIKIIDFGSSYSLSNLPNRLSTPCQVCSPEYLLYKIVGASSDIWSLGLLLYKLRMGDDLFTSLVGGEDEVLAQMEEILGPIAYNYKSTDARGFPVKSMFDEQPKSSQLQELIMRAWWANHKQVKSRENSARSSLDSEQQMRELQNLKAPNKADIITPTKKRRGFSLFGLAAAAAAIDEIGEIQLEAPRAVNMNAQEAHAFLDLMTGMLHYDVEKRLSTEEVLQHPWFRKDFW